MLRIACFVDYSNLLGSLSKLGLKIVSPQYYQNFFSYVVKIGYNALSRSFLYTNNNMTVSLNRVYWYAVANCDTYDFDNCFTRNFLQNIFHENEEIYTAFISQTAQNCPHLKNEELSQRAFDNFYEDRRKWYYNRQESVRGFRDFYNRVRKECDFIEISEVGYWKLSFISKSVEEKGIDTALAVDSVTMLDTYDVALILSGDADMIPSINYIKKQGKQVGVISFIKDVAQDRRCSQQSRRLSRAADFDAQIFASDLANLEFINCRC